MTMIFSFPGGQRGKQGVRIGLRLEILTPEECQRLLDEVPEDPYRTMLITALSVGLRVNELLALKWYDVDGDGSHIMVRRALVHGVARTLKNERYWKRRIGKVGATALRNWRSKSPFSAGNDWIFADPRWNGVAPYDAHWLWHRQFRPAVMRAGIHKSIHWHTLRLTCAVMMWSLGMDVFCVSRLLGYSIHTCVKRVGQVSSTNLAESRKLDQVLSFAVKKTTAKRNIHNSPTLALNRKNKRINVLPWRNKARR